MAATSARRFGSEDEPRSFAMRRPEILSPIVAIAVFSLAAAGGATHDAKAPEGWAVLKNDKIAAPREHGSAISATTGIRARMIGFRAVGGDLACGRISVSFVEGHTRWVEPGPDRLLVQGELYVARLWDDEEELLRVNYVCTPVAGTSATLQVLARG
jgi:hypothetical protein